MSLSPAGPMLPLRYLLYLEMMCEWDALVVGAAAGRRGPSEQIQGRRNSEFEGPGASLRYLTRT